MIASELGLLNYLGMETDEGLRPFLVRMSKVNAFSNHCIQTANVIALAQVLPEKPPV